MNKKIIAKFLSFLMLCSTSNSLISVQAMNSDHNVSSHQNIAKEFPKELNKAIKTLSKHNGVLELNGEIAVVGDIHGDVLSINTIIKELTPWLNANPDRKVLFLGDIFDRGDTATSLYLFLKFFNSFNLSNNVSTHRVFVLRGNHETRDFYLYSKQTHGRYLACNESIISQNESEIFKYMDQLPYAAILNGNTLAVHGGIPSNLNGKLYEENVRALFGKNLSKTETLTPPGNIEHFGNGGIYDIIWSDFNLNAQDFGCNKIRRGTGCEYGWNQLKEFFETLANVNSKYQNVKNIIHGHKHIDGPFQQLEHDGMTNTTVISSNNMCMKCVNSAHCSVAVVSPNKKPEELFKLNFCDCDNVNPIINVHKNNSLKSGLTGFGFGVAATAIVFTLADVLIKKIGTNKKLNPHNKTSKVVKQSKSNKVDK